MKLNIFNAPANSLPVDIALLITRLMFGYAFMLTGWGKIQNPLNWMGENSDYPGALQALAAVAEYCGGIAIILGLLTRVAAFGLACTMCVAVYTMAFDMKMPYVNLTGGMSYALPAIYLMIALLLMLIGPGRFSFDRILFDSKNTVNSIRD